MDRFRFSAVAAALALSLGIVAVAGAQGVPSLFTGTVRDAANTILSGAQVTGKVSVQVCGQARSAVRPHLALTEATGWSSRTSVRGPPPAPSTGRRWG